MASALAIGSNFKDVVNNFFIDLINTSIPVLAGLALLVFLWGLVKFISQADNEKARGDGKKLIRWGLIALFVMVSYIGIINFFQKDFDMTATHGPAQLPEN